MGSEQPFVNFEWTDFEARYGFSQLVYPREGPEQLANAMKIAVDQPDAKTWRMRIAFDRNVYKDREDREGFLENFQKALAEFLENPLALIWPEGCPQLCDSNADTAEA